MSAYDETLQALADKEAIRALACAYYEGQWAGDPQAIVNTFTRNGTITVHNGDLDGSSVTGHDALLQFYTEGLKQLRPRTFGHNHVIQLIDAENATGRLCIELRDSLNFSWVAATTVEDVYLKANGEWKILHRVARLNMKPASI